MKKQFAQLACFISKIDPRYARFAYFALAFAFSILMKSPLGGGTDPT